MDKYLVRLELRDGELHLSVRIHDGAAPGRPRGPGDAADGRLGRDVRRGRRAEPPWSPWRTYVFVRGAR
jgi:hypothetical protein